MKFLINVLPNDRYTVENVKQFILNVKSQRVSNVTLIFKKTSTLTKSVIDLIKNSGISSLIVRKYSDIKLNIHQQTYWVNLHVNDCLLPNAVTQWEQIIDRHSSDVIEISYLRNERSLVGQTGKIIHKINQEYPVRINTVKTVLHLPVNVPLFNLPLSSQLLILLGLQNYKVMDTIQRYRELNNSYLGFNFLMHCTRSLIDKLDGGVVRALVHMIINRPEIVKINLPTVILSRFNVRNRIEWLSELAKAADYIGDAKLLGQYRKFISDRINVSKKKIFNSKASRLTKRLLMSKINQVNKKLLQNK